MTIKALPIGYEAFDETGEMVFSIKVFDEAVSTIYIKTCITADSWDELSASIKECLVKLET